MRDARLHLPALKGNYYRVTPLIIANEISGYNHRVTFERFFGILFCIIDVRQLVGVYEFHGLIAQLADELKLFRSR